MRTLIKKIGLVPALTSNALRPMLPHQIGQHADVLSLALGSIVSIMPLAATGQVTLHKCIHHDGTVEISDGPSNSAEVKCTIIELPGYLPSPSVPPTVKLAQRKAEKPLSAQEGKQIAAYNLRDPEAARFREVFVSKSGNVCGQINSKNGYGAYTGYKSFFVLADTKLATIDGEQGSGLFYSSYSNACRTEGGNVANRVPGDASGESRTSGAIRQEDRGQSFAKTAFYHLAVEEKCSRRTGEREQHRDEFLKAVMGMISKQTGLDLAAVQEGVKQGTAHADRLYPSGVIPSTKACSTAKELMRPLHETWAGAAH